MRVNDIEITPLSDGSLHVPPTELLNKPAEAWAPHADLLDADGLLHVNFGGFLIRTPEHMVVVDCGIGSGALPELGIGTLPDELRRAGVAPDDVTDVVFTHLHFDHVGWATDTRRPFFPNAAHHCHALDWEFFCGADPAVEDNPGMEEDVDPQLAERTRAKLAGELSQTGGPATMTHDGGNSFGRIEIIDGARRWVRVHEGVRA
jgi:glyoxylase-like metal-dependent hydrolase (beta-lactamase superfamily II)